LSGAFAGIVNWIAANHARLNALRERGLVVKVGGSIQDDPAQLRAVCADVAILARLGFRPVLVHGGGKAITAAMTKAGLQARFVQGQRFTDPPTLQIVERVLVEGVNRELIGFLSDEGVRAEGLHSLGQCVLRGQRTGTDPAPDKPSEDLGLVGRVTQVNAPVVLGLTAAGVVPVIAPVALDAQPRAGEPGKLNVNADLAGGVVAAQLGAGAFILVSDTPGVRTDAQRADSFARTLSRAEVAHFTSTGVIAGGMLPKLTACLEALAAGAEVVRIVDGRLPRALLAAVLADADDAIPGTAITN
jgi:acetylglutamate kinase